MIKYSCKKQIDRYKTIDEMKEVHPGETRLKI